MACLGFGDDTWAVPVVALYEHLALGADDEVAGAGEFTAVGFEFGGCFGHVVSALGALAVIPVGVECRETVGGGVLVFDDGS